ncbi:hypothetical protein PRN20_03470 [Devosia sp. ZB163]|uniref:hypothetical protein n=1 Tax=Devosia sp. ZB163 TaxID=3025938 RepID=UPI00235FA95B|nr:hypothetical protein [Devosia sp. ZB163]MDC9822782.1 hypothetical protein [Devosia sp. ZB163]
MFRVVEDAFEVLRCAGLGPDVRLALTHILDTVIDDFDRDGRQAGNRAKYQFLIDRLVKQDTVLSSDNAAGSLLYDELPLRAPLAVPVTSGPVAPAVPDLAEVIRNAIEVGIRESQVAPRRTPSAL